MATTTNPFEPPRTTDLDAPSDGAAGRVSPAALGELVAAAPWVRRLVWLSALAIALQLIGIGIDLARGRRITTASVLIVAMTVLSILFLRILRWYDAASQRLRGGDTRAIGAIVDSQAAYLKLAGVTVTLATGLYVIFLAHAIAMGRFLSWMRP